MKAANEGKGFVISREGIDFDTSSLRLPGVNILSVYRNDKEALVLMQKVPESIDCAVIDITHCLNQFTWITQLQDYIKSGQKVVLFAQGQLINGILGLVNCLRREPNGSRISAFFMLDEAPKFDVLDEFYRRQLRKNLAINVWKDSRWGSYRHLLLEEQPTVRKEHMFVNVTVKGDLSSLRWIEGPHTRDDILVPEKAIVYVSISLLSSKSTVNSD